MLRKVRFCRVSCSPPRWRDLARWLHGIPAISAVSAFMLAILRGFQLSLHQIRQAAGIGFLIVATTEVCTFLGRSAKSWRLGSCAPFR